jgi:hypothetical protein
MEIYIVVITFAAKWMLFFVGWGGELLLAGKLGKEN